MRELMATDEPIVRRAILRCPIERAFRLFTEEMDTWWPLETHSIAVDQGLDQRAEALTLEPRQGGRLEEVLTDGSARRWATVKVWEPPDRVVYSWKPNELPTPPTEVEARFIRMGATSRLDVVHRGWAGLGTYENEIRPLYESEGGWSLVLERFREVAESKDEG
jgi:uncharacterized protein YndB with AHSA1/START domain